MGYKISDIPKGYVLSVFEIIFSIIIFIFLFVVSMHHFGRLVEIPSAPRKVVLKSAFIYRNISTISKTTSNLYLRVGQGDETYDYIIEASTREVQHLDLRKPRKLWVAVEPDSSKKFVWGVYDDELGLIISRAKIQQWSRQNNFSNYAVIVTWGVLSVFMLYLLIKYGVWNRFLAKRNARENH